MSLFDDRWAPITTEFGFVEAPVAVVREWWSAWQNQLLAPAGRGVRARDVVGELEGQLAALLPLSVAEARRVLIVPTRSRWTAVFANGHQGGDAAGLAFPARALGCRAVRVVNAPHVVVGGAVRRYGARMFELYGPDVPGQPLNTLRALSVANDGGRWRMDLSGTALPGEQPAWLAAKSVRDRFLPEHLAAILRTLDIDAFAASFYGSPGALIEHWGPPVRGYRERSLEEVQAEWAARAWADVEAGRVKPVAELRAKYARRRSPARGDAADRR